MRDDNTSPREVAPDSAIHLLDPVGDIVAFHRIDRCDGICPSPPGFPSGSKWRGSFTLALMHSSRLPLCLPPFPFFAPSLIPLFGTGVRSTMCHRRPKMACRVRAIEVNDQVGLEHPGCCTTVARVREPPELKAKDLIGSHPLSISGTPTQPDGPRR